VTKGAVIVVILPGTLYRDAALADGRSPNLRRGVSVLTENGRITWIRDSADEGPVPDQVQVVDAGGTTIIPGLVDGHSHLTLPGGSHWIDRAFDTTETLLEVAEANADLQVRSARQLHHHPDGHRRGVQRDRPDELRAARRANREPAD
jgi:imidazolonepropionase-like amidohydrolase